MSLVDGYGVLVGRLQSYFCDNGDDPESYYHCNIRVQAGRRVYRCAVDLDTKKQGDALRWRILGIGRNDLQGVADYAEGWHYLDSVPGSGALDYLRSPVLQPVRVERPSGSATGGLSPWLYGSSTEAFTDLEPLLAQASKLLVYGEPFRVGLGVHNIHQNQGDPVSSRWSAENGIWQDGAVVSVTASGEVLMFLSRFKTQATKTDLNGKPLSS
ncbi:YukJ family protein [Prosthecochloris sp. N3]|uniref:YukJ family protein n=1 Tax=Prosthecochloris ethylica TaxID=2743976 RepID=A0ABR9XP84_9CHLB|nr:MULTISPECIES: DUF2278 family protein [Prosthecochloris]MBF0585723.1 YukJ family protein [Prosthecochloris ethylica]MBF0635633.1 YukJ family protein [Prosthecochloris ethylica]NUK46932.1 YukJ family protein [Prosthecochloris ethylica]RNA65427.1 DUF2278 family protein [Prosthecochloris sp. ZM_2]